MNISWYKILPLATLGMLIGLGGDVLAAVDDDARPTVVTAHEAFAILPAELIAAPTVVEVEPSPDLRYLLVVRQERTITPMGLQAVAAGGPLPPFSQMALVLWDSLSHESREVWRLSAAEGTISRVEWMLGSAAALVMIQQVIPADTKGQRTAESRTSQSQIKNAVLRVDAASAKAELLTAGSNSTVGLRWTMSPTQPVAVLVSEESTPPAGANGNGEEISETFIGIGPAGPLGPRAALPPGTQARLQWAEDGSPTLTSTTKVPGGPDVTATYTLDLPTGKLRSRKPLDRHDGEPMPARSFPSPAANAVAMLPVTLEITKARVNDGEGATNGNMLWLQSNGVKPGSRALVSLDASEPSILPGCQGIVYTAKGAVWVAPVVRMSMEQYGREWQKEQKKVAANHAKMLGTAIICWAQDYDEKYPTPDNLKAKLLPYLQDEGVFKNFVYTYPGGDLAAIDEPAETVLGYVTGPGGQATLYADGHVRWKDD